MYKDNNKHAWHKYKCFFWKEKLSLWGQNYAGTLRVAYQFCAIKHALDIVSTFFKYFLLF